MNALNAPASPRELFIVFTKMALQGFGGVLPVAQHVLVERQRWLTKAQFVEMLSIAQILPGPNVVNLTLMLGDRYFGWRGAAAALTGILGVPLVIVLLLAAAYHGMSAHPLAAGALRGMAAVSAGLVLGMAFKLWPALKDNPNGPWWCGAIALVCVAAATVLRWPLLAIVLGLGGGSWWLSWWRLRSQAQRANEASRDDAGDRP